MIQILPHKDTHAIPVPLEAHDYDFVNSCTKHLTFTSRGINLTIAMNVSTLDKYKILGEVTKSTVFLHVDDCKLLKDNPYSLLAANGVYFENPIELKYIKDFSNIDGYINYDNKWQSFQDKLVDKVLIIQKVVL